MKDLIQKFESTPPEVIFEWNDKETEAQGWVVINSLRGGAAGGGTRMRKGLNEREVESLAKTMEIKFTVSGPSIGGAKSGINFDPHDPRKRGVLERWYKAVTPLLKNYYGTGGDMNVDEIDDVIPITESFGLWHPQEGIVNGHYQPSESEKINKIGQLRQGVSKVIEDPEFAPASKEKYTVADMITGYGVAESVIQYYGLWGGALAEKRAIIQGWGNVGAAAGFYLAQKGVRIVGIIDKTGGLIREEGLSFDEVAELFINRDDRKLVSDHLIPFEEADEKLWDIDAEIFIPAAGSRLVRKEHVEKLISGGLELISSGANVPFDDSEIFYGPTLEFADTNLSVIPDFIANCGMARVFAYLMEENAEVTDHAIFNDVSHTVNKALSNIYGLHTEKNYLTRHALEYAVSQLT